MIQRRRERALLALLGLTALALGAIGLDASTRGRVTETRQMARIAEATGLSDLALSSSSRWLRHPSLAEPGAATWDAPLGLDVDPAGATIPAGVLAEPPANGSARFGHERQRVAPRADQVIPGTP